MHEFKKLATWVDRNGLLPTGSDNLLANLMKNIEKIILIIAKGVIANFIYPLLSTN